MNGNGSSKMMDVRTAVRGALGHYTGRLTTSGTDTQVTVRFKPWLPTATQQAVRQAVLQRWPTASVTVEEALLTVRWCSNGKGHDE